MKVLAVLAVVVAALAPAAEARAQDVPDDPDFGPAIVIEDIEVVGNRSTQADVIVRALPIATGDALRAGDKRLRDARFKLLALGFFRDVTLGLRKGSARGRVILTVTVVERGTIVLNRLWFGTSVSSPYWFGVDAGERNLLGTGLALVGGAIYAGHGDITGSRDQWAARLRIADPSVLGTEYGVHGAFAWNHGSEPFRVAGAPGDDDAGDFRAFSYRRFRARGGGTWDATAFTSFGIEARLELIDADVPTAPTRTLEDGRVTAVDLHLRPGKSEVVSVKSSLERDTRADPVRPRSGSRFVAQAELGSTLLGGSYDFASVDAHYERWWPAGRTGALGVRLRGAVVLGDPPRFELIHVGDFNPLLTPRALGLTLSASSSGDLLGTGTDEATYGEVGGSAGIEYARHLFTRTRIVYGGDWFVGGGLWALSSRDDLALRDASVWRSLPVDLFLDAGLRLDTGLGIFEITIANALGRVPL